MNIRKNREDSIFRLGTIFFLQLAAAVLAISGVHSANAFGAESEEKTELIYASGSRLASVEDRAQLLTEEEETELLKQAAELSQKTGYELRLVTTDQTEGKTTQQFAEAYFESLTDDGPETASGASYVIDMDNRQIYIATYGGLQYYLTDARVDALLDHAYEYVSEGEYDQTFESMLKDTGRYYRKGIPDGTRIVNQDTGEVTVYHKPKTVTPVKVLISLLAGTAGFLAFFASVKSAYSMKGISGDGFSERDQVGLTLKRRDDRLVNQFVTSRRIPRNDGGGGSSGGGTTSTHTTSGGYSAGGGGRSF